MTALAVQLLEQFRKLPSTDQRELGEAILREAASRPAGETVQPRKTIGDVAGKYRPLPPTDAKEHDRGFAEAVAASKSRSRAA